jgi:hypothetical protein
MNDDDFCFYKEGNCVKAMGWDINSPLLCSDTPIASYQSGDTKAVLQNLAIPAGLILLQNRINSNTSFKDIIEPGIVGESKIIEEPKTIGDDLYTKLLQLGERKKRMLRDTRKRRKKVKNKTRRNK